jgi:trans-aconitate methyltransferase
MMTGVRITPGTAEHWDDAYRHGDTTRSWFQSQAAPSLRMLDAAGVRPTDSVIDVGGGASTLVDALLERGHTDVTVLDISGEGMRTAQQRLGARASRVHWLIADLLTWAPDRTWQVWHDRAVLHFFTTHADRRRYVHTLHSATEPGSVAIIATFAPDGPRHCSGLPVAHYDPRQLAELLGPTWQPLTDAREEHATPAGALQPFTWTAFRRQA